MNTRPADASPLGYRPGVADAPSGLPLRRTSIVLALVAILAPGCGFVGGPKPAGAPSGPEDTGSDTPRRAFLRLKSALKERDWEAVYDTAVSPSQRKSLEADFEKTRRRLAASAGDAMFAESVLGVRKEEYHRMDARDFFVATSEASGKASTLLAIVPDRTTLQSSRIVETKVEGDEATLILELESGGRRPLWLVREDGRWYFQLTPD